MNFSALLTKIVIFIVLLAIGFFMARKKILGTEFTKSASALLLNVFITASIVNSVLGSRPEISSKEFGKAFLMVTLVIVLTYTLAFLFSAPFRKEKNSAQTEIILAVTNTLFVGLPIASAVCGSEAVFYIGMSCIPYNIILYTYGIWKLKRGMADSKIHMKDMISTCLVASIASLLIFLLNLPVPKLVSELFATVSAATVPVSMIVIGASLGSINPAIAFAEKRNYYFVLVRLIVAPILTFLIVRCLTDNQTLVLTCTVMAGCPVGSIVTPLSIKYGYDVEYASKAIMVTTIFSMLTLPLLIRILFA